MGTCIENIVCIPHEPCRGNCSLELEMERETSSVTGEPSTGSLSSHLFNKAGASCLFIHDDRLLISAFFYRTAL